MIAGELEIRIAAVYDQLNRDLSAAQTASSKAGQASGQQFGQQFSTSSSTYLSQAADSIGMKFRKALSGANMAQTIANSLEAGIRSGSNEEALKAAVAAIPIVGGLMNAIADAIYEAHTGEKAKAAAEALAKEQHRIGVEYRTKMTRLEHERIATAQQGEIDAAMEVDKRKGLIEKMRLDVFNSRVNANERQQVAVDDRERAAIEEIHRLREKGIRDRLARELKALDEADAKAKKLADEQKAREAKELADKQAAEMKKIDEEARQRIDALRQQQAAVQSSVSTVQTAHGAFRFSSYTEQEKKQIDRSILDEIKVISATAAKMRDAVQTGGGFN